MKYQGVEYHNKTPYTSYSVYLGRTVHFSKLRAKCLQPLTDDSTFKVEGSGFSLPAIAVSRTRMSSHCARVDLMGQSDTGLAMQYPNSHMLTFGMPVMLLCF